MSHKSNCLLLVYVYLLQINPHKTFLYTMTASSYTLNSQVPCKCKAQPRRALLGYPFRNTAAHTEATPTREGI